MTAAFAPRMNSSSSSSSGCSSSFFSSAYSLVSVGRQECASYHHHQLHSKIASAYTVYRTGSENPTAVGFRLEYAFFVVLPVGRLVHGNTLTAAVVVENVKAAIEADPAAAASASSTGPSDAHPGSGASGSNRPCVFLTGATSKVRDLRACAFDEGADQGDTHPPI